MTLIYVDELYPMDRLHAMDTVSDTRTDSGDKKLIPPTEA